MKLSLKMKMWQKIALMIFLMAVGATLMIFYLLHTRDKATMNLAEKERAGVEQLMPVTSLFKNLIDYRDTVDLVLSGDNSGRRKLENLASDIEKDIKAAESSDRRLDKVDITRQLNNIKTGWQEVREQPINPGVRLESHTKLVSDSFDLISYIRNKSGLIHDPDLDTHYLIAVSLQNAPKIYDDLGKLRTVASTSAERGTITQEEKLQLAALIGRIRLNLDSIKSGMEVAYSSTETGNLKKKVSPALVEAAGRMASFEELISQLMAEYITLESDLTDTNIVRDSNEYFAMGSLALDGFSDFNKVVLDNLDDLLVNRIEDLISR